VKHIIEILKENGFEQMFPFVEAFIKGNIHVNVSIKLMIEKIN